MTARMSDLCPMPRAGYSSHPGLVGASLMTAGRSTAMSTANSFFHSPVVASVMTAYFMIPMTPADAPSDNFVGAPFMTAFLCLCTMSDTDTSLDDDVSASLMTACLASKLRPVPPADASALGEVGASSLEIACFM